jgi:hypothetical protein
MKKKLVTLTVINKSGFSLVIAGLSIKSHGDAPTGQDFNLTLGKAKQAEREMASLNLPMKCSIEEIEEKTAEKVAVDIASVELGQSQVIADSLKAQVEVLTAKAEQAFSVVKTKQLAFNEVQAIFNESQAKEVEADSLKQVNTNKKTTTDSNKSDTTTKAKAKAKVETATKKGNE